MLKSIKYLNNTVLLVNQSINQSINLNNNNDKLAEKYYSKAFEMDPSLAYIPAILKLPFYKKAGELTPLLI